MIKQLLSISLTIYLFDQIASASAQTLPEALAANIQAYSQTTQQYQRQAPLGIWPKATSTFYNNSDKSKIEALYGQWRINVPAQQPRVDILEVNTAYSDKDFGYYGWDSKSKVSCFYEPKMYGSPYGYLCLYLDAAGTAQRYLFNINGNTLSGQYHVGTAADFITKLNANQLLSISGTNANTSINPLDSSAEPYFNDVNGELTIPKVSAYGKRYHVIMQRERNGLFSLKSADQL